MIEITITVPHSPETPERIGRMVVEALSVPGGTLTVRSLADPVNLPVPGVVDPDASDDFWPDDDDGVAIDAQPIQVTVPPPPQRRRHG